MNSDLPLCTCGHTHEWIGGERLEACTFEDADGSCECERFEEADEQ